MSGETPPALMTKTEALLRILELSTPYTQQDEAELAAAMFEITKLAKDALGITTSPIGCSGD
jgi:hypothetical protein